MKALVITSRYPFTYFGGDATRTLNLIDYLNNLDFEVDLLSFSDKETKPICKKNINEQHIIHNRNSITRNIYICFSIFSRRPIQCSYFINQNTKQYLNKFDFDKYDVIIIFLTRLSPIIEFIKDKNKIIFDMADILTINYKNAWKAKGLALKWKIIYSIEYFLIRMEERKLLNSQFKKLLVSERDFNYALNNLDGKRNNLFILPNHIDNLSFKDIKNSAKLKFINRDTNLPFKICFIGNMEAQHNHSSMVSLIKSKVIKRLKSNNISITIIGRMNKKREIYYKTNNFNVISNPKNLMDVAKSFDCGISLLKHCSGLQNKLYEYALLGIPIIASRESADGIGFKNKKEYLLAKSHLEFLEKALFLKNNPNFAYELSINCGRFISKRYSFENIIEKFTNIIKSENY